MKKIKNLIIIFIITLGLFSLTGCSDTAMDYNEFQSKNTQKDLGRFVQIYQQGDQGYQIFYDKETMVEYVAYNGHYCTMLVKADGTPYLYEGR